MSSVSSLAPDNVFAYIEEGIVQLQCLWEDVVEKEGKDKQNEETVKTHPSDDDSTPTTNTTAETAIMGEGKKERNVCRWSSPEQCHWNTKPGAPTQRSFLFPFLVQVSTSPNENAHTDPPAQDTSSTSSPPADASLHVDPLEEGTLRARKGYPPAPIDRKEGEEPTTISAVLHRKREREDLSGTDPLDPVGTASLASRRSSETHGSVSALPPWLSRPAALQRLPHLPTALCEQIEKEWEKQCNGGSGGERGRGPPKLLNPIVLAMLQSSAGGEAGNRHGSSHSSNRSNSSCHVSHDVEEEKEEEQVEDSGDRTTSSSSSTPLEIPERCQLRVVFADVTRSLWNLYSEESERDLMRGCLAYTILRVLCAAPEGTLHYTQGLHDLVGSVMFLLCSFREKILGTESKDTAEAQMAARLEMVAGVCFALLQTHWAPFACESLEEVQSMANALSLLLVEEHPTLYHALDELAVLDHPHFLFSWLITWFHASLSDIPSQMFLLMFFLKSQDALTPLFFSTALVIRGADILLSSVEEFKRQCAADGIASWKDYSYGLMFQRLSILPTTLLDPPKEIKNGLAAHTAVARTDNTNDEEEEPHTSPPEPEHDAVPRLRRKLRRRERPGGRGGNFTLSAPVEGDTEKMEQESDVSSLLLEVHLLLLGLAATTQELRSRHVLLRIDPQQEAEKEKREGEHREPPSSSSSQRRGKQSGSRILRSCLLLCCIWQSCHALFFGIVLGILHFLSRGLPFLRRAPPKRKLRPPMPGTCYYIRCTPPGATLPAWRANGNRAASLAELGWVNGFWGGVLLHPVTATTLAMAAIVAVTLPFLSHRSK